MTGFRRGDRVTLRRHPARGAGTVTGNPCTWPRCPHTECVEVRWDNHHPNLAQNHDTSHVLAS